MIVLALDTTTRAGSAAVIDDDRVLALWPGDAARTHAERLPGEFARVLEMAGKTKEQIDLLAVATGPGAFTGLRIGIAAMQGLAMTLNKPVIGVSALDALAAQGESHSSADLIVPWMDAQRGEVFASLIDAKSGATIEAPTAATPQLLLDTWRPHLVGRHVVFIGDAAVRDRGAISATSVDGPRDTRLQTPLAVEIGRIGRRRAIRGEAGPPHALEPIYVRRPDAEIERERRGRP